MKYTKGDIAEGCIRFTVLRNKNKSLYQNLWTTENQMRQLSQYCITTSFVVCYTAVFRVVTQWGGALRDDTKNGCVADYQICRCFNKCLDRTSDLELIPFILIAGYGHMNVCTLRLFASRYLLMLH